MGAAATLDGKDVLHGCTLAWVGNDDENASLQMYRWQVSVDGKLTKLPALPIAWPPDRAVSLCRLRISSSGRICGLLKADGGKWRVFDNDGKSSELAIPDDTEAQVMFIGSQLPLIRYVDTQRAFKYVVPDGREFPTW